MKIPNLKLLIPIIVLFLLAGLGLGLYFSGRLKTAQQENEQESRRNDNQQNVDKDSGKSLFSFSLVKPVFAEYQEIKTTTKPVLTSEKVRASDLVNIGDFSAEDIEFTLEQKKALEDMGFFLTENKFIKKQESGQDDFTDTYQHFTGNTNKYYRGPDDTLFITSDVALHLYHILIDRSFQKIEEVKFQPRLREITQALFADSINNYNQAMDPAIKESCKRLSVFYLIPLVVLDSAAAEKAELSPADFDTYAKYIEAEEQASKKMSEADLEFSLVAKKYNGVDLSDEVYDLAKQELDLIKAAKGLANSPLFTPMRPYFKNDYSQFKPRSHYTKNKILKSYFVSMMWYGRMGFSLDSQELTRDALIITSQVNSLEANGEKISKTWSDMASAIEFFVGEDDDLTPYHYTDLIKDKFNGNLTVGDLTNEEFLSNFIKTAINDLPKPRIVSEAVDLYDNGGERDKFLKQLMQFRFMGQKFTPDAYIMNQLTQGVGAPDPETGQKLPSMTTALMPISILNFENSVVKEYINEWVKNNAPDSDKIIAKKLNKLNGEFSAYGESVWTQNIYWNWLNSYRSLLSGYGQGYPYFMTTEAWQKKNLGTVLGSYTELKHDTLLYAKQSYAELGGGGDNPAEIPPVPKGYVEPDLLFWTRIIALAEMTKAGLEQREIMPEEFKARYENFINVCEFFRGLVEKELKNEIISDEDFEKLRTISNSLSRLVEALPGKELTIKEKRAGIIADIHTDAVKSKILYEATGKPYIIYVAVKDVNGARLTRGLTFNHYEFTDKLDERLADEDWQEIVYDQKGSAPTADKWSQELIR